jgi:hypothetical protein
MPFKDSVAAPGIRRAPKPQPSHLNVPQFHILIIAWSALVILYGEPG